MRSHRLSWIGPLLIVFVLGAAAFGAFLLIQDSRIAEEAQLWENYRIQMKEGELKDAGTRVEFFFKNIYETARTIGLIPGVRSVVGNNRSSADQDAVTLKRLDLESDVVGKNLYLNLASNFTVSEIYCVLNGFDPAQGQVPFFMYDSTISGAEDSSAPSNSNSKDVPPQIETEEYTYFPTVLSQFAQNYPVYSFKDLKSIPVVYSSVMRTCDNTQYDSILNGDVAHTNGLISSVPFYGPKGQFKGLIAVIYRLDTIEALMLDVPFLPITKSDKIKAERQKWALPKRPSRLFLTNEPLGIGLSDSRLPHLKDEVAVAKIHNDPNLLQLNLNVPGNRDWKMWYLIDAAAAEKDVLSGSEASYHLKLVVLAAGFMFCLLMLVFEMRRRANKRNFIDRIVHLTEKASEGDLTVAADIPKNLSKDLRVLMTAFQKLTRKLAAILYDVSELTHKNNQLGSHLSTSSKESASAIGKVKNNVNELNSAMAKLDQEIASSSAFVEEIMASIQSLASGVVKQNDAVEKLSATIEQISASIQKVAALANEKNSTVSGLVELIQSSNVKVQSTNSIVSEISRSTKTILQSINTIDEISSQTNLLAMNASIEAAHSGSEGKGFAVIASEIRKLAVTTKTLATTVGETLRTMAAQIQSAAVAGNESSQAFSRINLEVEQFAQAFQLVATNMKEIADANNHFLDTVNDLVDISVSVKTSSQEMAVGTQEILRSTAAVRNVSRSVDQEIGAVSQALKAVEKVDLRVSVLSNQNRYNNSILLSHVSQFKTGHTEDGRSDLQIGIDWSDILSVGIPSMDDEHKELFKRINALLVDLLSDAKETKKLLDAIMEYTEFHFDDEQTLMQKYNYPKFEQHYQLHEKFKVELTKIGNLLLSETLNAELLIQLQDKVVNWLLDHIAKVDHDYGEFVVQLQKDGKIP